jgi:hypothetical protein
VTTKPRIAAVRRVCPICGRAQRTAYRVWCKIGHAHAEMKPKQAGQRCPSCGIGVLARYDDTEMDVPLHAGFHNPATGSGLRFERRTVPTIACNSCEYIVLAPAR